MYKNTLTASDHKKNYYCEIAQEFQLPGVSKAIPAIWGILWCWRQWVEEVELGKEDWCIIFFL